MRALIVAVLLIGMAGTLTYAGTGSAPAQEMILDARTMEQLVMLSTPGEKHETLTALSGTWYYTAKFWDGNNAEPHVSSGSIANEMILGGRFLLSRTSLLLNI
jgi:hypothetical protein